MIRITAMGVILLLAGAAFANDKTCMLALGSTIIDSDIGKDPDDSVVTIVVALNPHLLKPAYLIW